MRSRVSVLSHTKPHAPDWQIRSSAVDFKLAPEDCSWYSKVAQGEEGRQQRWASLFHPTHIPPKRITISQRVHLILKLFLHLQDFIWKELKRCKYCNKCWYVIHKYSVDRQLLEWPRKGNTVDLNANRVLLFYFAFSVSWEACLTSLSLSPLIMNAMKVECNRALESQQTGIKYDFFFLLLSIK